MIKSARSVPEDLSAGVSSSAVILSVMAEEISDIFSSKVWSQRQRIFWGGIAGTLEELSQEIRDHESKAAE